MKSYRSHKTVEAAKVEDVHNMDVHTWSIRLEGGQVCVVDDKWMDRHRPAEGKHALIGGYLVLYADNYVSWSPAAAFEAGHTELNLDVEPAPKTAEDLLPKLGTFLEDNASLGFLRAKMDEADSEALQLATISTAVSAKRMADALTRIADELAGTLKTSGIVAAIYDAARGPT